MERERTDNFQATLLRRNEIADSTFLLELDVSKSPFSFQAGQYLWLKVDELFYPDPQGATRAFSIASSPKEDTVEIIFRGSTSGFKRTLLKMPLDSSLELIGPFGFFVPHLSLSKRKNIFIAGGVGVTPF